MIEVCFEFTKNEVMVYIDLVIICTRWTRKFAVHCSISNQSDQPFF